ncbi:MAG: hypothetical protein COZ46_07750 [Verrucomicrobia bacterium CG_4_10_14_3_um_filter_43_23]|nr:MAG: hypothetical protein AUJ82_03640 [Verrucomicrobia bacterium CG1_02_43_26]PIP58923.1 MAG: hypothetical protein COX01_06065 [Verrucomicrobia bacterium CG22_combo_CG10-13_8_21_14_all_43_17]PIX57650.1 MAG: hypothetical protein COZ46_07750 [Verrucomicrobia bacterium CG_4_10_14_3_um_filter_43_23]PIY61785.1 MAG: hypothetical protein COY94_03655 [Verrucomicrobia bacterium CG_4_10_14_0_8_um_filter_43_34]PJA44734.1 MAG: hypothetical protein CO175_01215 [Verrucomicrobia bacterium CG_4_9_14_3_um_fi
METPQTLSTRDSPIVGKLYTFPARVEYVEGLRREFTHFLKYLGIEGGDLESWKLVFSEAVVNAVLHGSKEDPSKQVTVDWSARGDEVWLEVIDCGHGPAIETTHQPGLPDDPLAQSGRGLYIIKQFCNSWQHWYGSSGYRQVLIRKQPEIIANDPSQKIIDSTIEELAQCYESLAAFHHLGRALIDADSVSNFIENAIQDISRVVPNNGVFLYFGKALNPTLLKDLQQISYYKSVDEGDIPNIVIEEGQEFIWEKPSEITKNSSLYGFNCGICCPIRASQQILGTLTVACSNEKHYINASDLNTVRTFADLFGIAVAHENNTIMRSREQRALQELEIASEIQKTLLPIPEIKEQNHWRLFAQRKSAREVSGDYVDACIGSHGELYLAIVDVMGKGVSAAFLAAVMRTALHIATRNLTGLNELVNMFNETLRAQIGDLTIFATCAVVMIPPSLDRAFIINAGHCPVLFFRNNSLFKQFEPSGPPLGLFDDINYKVDEIDLHPHDSFLMVTDGLYEVETAGKIWGWDNLVNFIQSRGVSDPKELWDELQQVINAASPDRDTGDDQTILHWEYTSKL